MSSALRGYAQIKPQLKFLQTLSETASLSNDAYDGIVAEYGSSAPVIAVADLASVIDTALDISGGTLLKDLGREIYVNVQQVSGVVSRAIILRQVQIVNGPGSAGVPDVAQGGGPTEWGTKWVVTWAADPSAWPVTVARTG